MDRLQQLQDLMTQTFKKYLSAYNSTKKNKNEDLQKAYLIVCKEELKKLEKYREEYDSIKQIREVERFLRGRH